jgi:hypothetical protein
MPGASKGQLGVMARLLTDAGVTSRTHRIEIVSGLAGRTLESTNDLSVGEARSILLHLQQLNEIDELGLLVEQYSPVVRAGGES